MRPKYIVSLVIGCLLIYLSIYGLAGFGLSWTSASSLPTHEEFDVSGAPPPGWVWGGVSPIISSGTLQMQAGKGGEGSGDNRSAAVSNIPSTCCNGVTQYTMTIRVKANWTSSGGWLDIGFRGAGSQDFWGFGINSTYMWSRAASVNWKTSVITDTNYHTYTFLVTILASQQPSIDIYKDTSLIASSILGSTSTVWYAQLSLDTWQTALVNVDYVYFDAGLNPPGLGTATLTVNTDYLSGGNHIPLDGVPVTAAGTTKNTVSGTTSFPSLTPGSISVSVPSPYSSYTFSAWSDGGAISHSVTLPSSGLTLTATYVPTVVPTYSLTINAQSGGVAIGGMSAAVNSGQAQTITTSGTTFGPYTSSYVSVTIDSTYGTYSFSSWLGDGSSNPRIDTLAQGSNAWTAVYTQGSSDTYSLTINAQCNGATISGMSATVNSQAKTIASSGAAWGPYTSPSVTASIDASYGTYTFSYWLINGANYGSSPPANLNLGSNTWTAVYTSSSQPEDILTQLWNSIIAWIRTMQNNDTVKEAELGIGGLMVLVSVIGFCWPGEKRFYTLPSVGG